MPQLAATCICLLDFFVNSFNMFVSNQELLMKKGFLLSLVFALATLAGGYWLGKQSAAKPAAPTATVSTKTSSEETPALPPEKSTPRTSTPATSAPGKLSLAEIK